MDPRPDLRGHHRVPVDAGRGCRPAGLGDPRPSPALTLEDVREAVAAHRGGRLAVALNAERYAVPGRPAPEDLEEVVLVQLRQRPAEVDPQLLGIVGVDEQ